MSRPSAAAAWDVEAVRREFPILDETVNGSRSSTSTRRRAPRSRGR
ncbi:MAG: hypothetical protein U0599_15205 [Vicinamibacteria bacterium]